MGHFVGGNRQYPVLAEASASQLVGELNSLAAVLFDVVPGVVVVILIKIHDDASVENGKM